MKKFFTICLLSMMCLFAFAQISKSDYDKLPQEVKDQISQSLSPESQVDQKLKETSEYVSIGHEIGLAVNETLSALKETVVDVSETRVGKIAITIVIWKLLGKDILGIIVGTILLITCIVYGSKYLKTIKLIVQKSDEVPKSESDGWCLTAVVSVILFVILFIGSMMCYF